LVTFVSPAKTAELIEMPSGMMTRMAPGNHVLIVLDGALIPHGEWGSFLGLFAPINNHWEPHAYERGQCGLLSNYLDYLFVVSVIVT